MIRVPEPATNTAGGHPSTMSACHPLRLVVEFDSTAEPVAGLVRREGRDAEAFTGWMALTRAIELLIHPAPSAPDRHQLGPTANLP
jgi:hypothetical protein